MAKDERPCPGGTPLPVASICATCVTPGYCTKNNTCAQGNKLTDEVADAGAELCSAR